MTRTLQQLFDLQGKTALVTGGSRGLGLQMAHALGEAGAHVLLSSRKAADLEAAAAELKAAGIHADWIAADCGQEEDIHRLGAETLQRLGHVDILVNNAGAAWGAPAEDHPVAAWDKVMDLNIRGYFILSQYLAKHSMIPRRQGSIINIASIAGLAGNPWMPWPMPCPTCRPLATRCWPGCGSMWPWPPKAPPRPIKDVVPLASFFTTMNFPKSVPGCKWWPTVTAPVPMCRKTLFNGDTK